MYVYEHAFIPCSGAVLGIVELWPITGPARSIYVLSIRFLGFRWLLSDPSEIYLGFLVCMRCFTTNVIYFCFKISLEVLEVKPLGNTFADRQLQTLHLTKGCEDRNDLVDSKMITGEFWHCLTLFFLAVCGFSGRSHLPIALTKLIRHSVYLGLKLTAFSRSLINSWRWSLWGSQPAKAIPFRMWSVLWRELECCWGHTNRRSWHTVRRQSIIIIYLAIIINDESQPNDRATSDCCCCFCCLLLIDYR